MKFFALTAEINDIPPLRDLGAVDGIITQTAQMCQSPKDRHKILRMIASDTDGPVFTDITHPDAPAMIREARALSALADTIAITLPITPAGLRACRSLSNDGIMVNATLCFTAGQALLAAKSGAAFVSLATPTGGDVPTPSIDDIAALYALHDYDTQIIAVAHSTVHISQAAQNGAHCAAAPPDVFHALAHHPHTEAGLAAFFAEAEKTPLNSS